MQNFRRTIGRALAALWVLCILHCLSDRATAHWHSLPSGEAHHHHHATPEFNHPEPDDSETHEHGEPDTGHSHEGTPIGSQCCDLKVRPSTTLFGDRTLVLELLIVNPFSPAGLPPASIQSVALRRGLGAEERSNLFSGVTSHIRTLVAPNAPPSTSVS